MEPPARQDADERRLEAAEFREPRVIPKSGIEARPAGRSRRLVEPSSGNAEVSSLAFLERELAMSQLGHESSRIDRLDEVVIEPGVARALDSLWLPIARQSNQKQVPEARVTPQAPGYLVAVHARQTDVEEDHFRVERL